MNDKFTEIVNQCRKPNTELLRKALIGRREFSEAESNFITYMAGYSHYEFAESLFPAFNLAFITGTALLFDRNNKKLHVKILINDQSHYCKKLHFGNIERDYRSPVFWSRTAFRDRDGLYIDSLGKRLRGASGEKVRAYIAQGISSVHENVISYQQAIQGYCLVTHFVKAAEPNVDINLKTLFSRATACIFVNCLSNSRNVSIEKLQQRDDLYQSLKSIYWYVLNTRKPELVTYFLQKIEANFQLIPYIDTGHDYLQEVRHEIETKILAILSCSWVEERKPTP
ncbi:hypothetical protein [Aliterella atlantica]|uniref:Uncharacterized protein n=1 Tax=Aliterella atlantica CENA595 TaxID=1618023 RepID=A0A0D8ZNE3_9CYAN|nr:hypothetical protein [Aliterella atlantica]KJH69877.1 hypothetical protein UH38_21315 [Aliterella atlantica CENA595]